MRKAGRKEEQKAARMIAEQQLSVYVDLENLVDARQSSTPLTVLEALSGMVIIDEVQ